MYKYYEIFEEIKTKDSKGNITKSFSKIGDIRGQIITKENQIFQEEKGLITQYQKVFITNRTYKSLIKNGYKIDKYIIKQVLENAGTIVCILNNL